MAARSSSPASPARVRSRSSACRLPRRRRSPLRTFSARTARRFAPRAVVTKLLADLVADAIFLLVERRLLELRDMAAILARHGALFLANLMIVLMQARRLLVGHLAFLHFLMNAEI